MAAKEVRELEEDARPRRCRRCKEEFMPIHTEKLCPDCTTVPPDLVEYLALPPERRLRGDY